METKTDLKHPFFTAEERGILFNLYRQLLRLSGDALQPDDCRKLKQTLQRTVESGRVGRDLFGLNPIIKDMQTAVIVADEIGMRRASILGVMLHDTVRIGLCTTQQIAQEYGDDVAGIVRGLLRVQELYTKSPAVESENFRNLLLSFAEDVRVILIMIANRVNLMRQIKDATNDEARLQVAGEAAYLYAPLAHKLGLYKLKSELEDLALKYTEHDIYYHIKEKLNETKASRDRYIAAFIGPIEQKLKEAGLKFHIKGRTKSIHSIYQKMKKQKCAFEGVYDLFAIRVILDAAPEREKQECWQVYSIVTDMYQPNPKRLRDWLSVPKSNGYESLHITVMGPEGKWVEVQIRTERMDEVAERGLAAHWRYKGVKGESGLDEWLTSVREALESNDAQGLEAMDQFKMDLYEDEVFVFTPKGDLFKLGKGSTVLDFAFAIHSRVGCRCIGAKVNGRIVPLDTPLETGDRVEIMTSSAAKGPSMDWLKIVKTQGARSKIRQYFKRELRGENVTKGKDLLDREAKRRGLQLGVLMKDENLEPLLKKYAFSDAEDIYGAVGYGMIAAAYVITRLYEEQQKAEEAAAPKAPPALPEVGESAAARTGKPTQGIYVEGGSGMLVRFARCCNPVPGDDIVGYITRGRGVTVHKADCVNAQHSEPERAIRVSWAEESIGRFTTTIQVIAYDHPSLLGELTVFVQDGGAPISAMSVKISKNKTCTIQMEVQVESREKLDAVLARIRKRPDVIEAFRLGR